MKPSEYLKDHWWPGRLWKQGDECIATVVRSRQAETGIDCDAWNKALSKVTGIRYLIEIFKWNDSPGRTLEEVLEVAKKAEDLVLGNAK